MLTEVDAADQFPDDDKINTLIYDRLFQRRSICQLGPDLGRTVIGVNAHTCSQPKQTLLWAHSTGNIVPLGTTNRAQKNTIRSQTLLKFGLRQRIAVLINGAAAHIHIGIGKGVSVKLGYFVQHIQCLLHDLRTNAVTTDHCNIFLHIKPLLSEISAGRQP